MPWALQLMQSRAEASSCAAQPTSHCSHGNSGRGTRRPTCFKKPSVLPGTRGISHMLPIMVGASAVEQRRLLPQEWGHTKPATCSCPSLCEEGTFDLMSTTPANPVQDFCNPEACGYLKTRSYMGAHNCRTEVIYGQH